MVRVKPFRGIRPKAELAAEISALPYDIMNRREAKAMAEGNAVSFLHISRAEIDFPDDIGDYDDCVYEKAKDNLSRFMKNGTLFMEETPVYYIYRETMGSTVQTGLVAAVAVDDYENGAVMKHELTRKEKEQDRIRHFDVCNCHTEPVFLTYRHQDRIDAIVDQWVKDHPSVYDFVSEDNVGHTLWVMDAPDAIASLESSFRDLDKMYIADGHHRTASAAAVGKLRREQCIQRIGVAPYDYFMAVIFPDRDLSIMAYNRVVRRPDGQSYEEILASIKENFMVEKVEGLFYPTQKHEFGLYLRDSWYKLTAHDCLYCHDDPAKNLDASILQTTVLEPIFGIKDIRTDKRIDFIGGIRGNEEIVRRCHAENSIGFALYPVEIADLMKISDSGKIMPPKSTWFEPKLRSGLFLHYLEDEFRG
ncbi:MAG: DUF1015 family protein [Bacillota bacterium]|nr:DUF1015 family protein [Bacillota bacterium]